jgi:hypothetical protein
VIAYKPTHEGIDLDRGFNVFISIIPNRLPSYLLSESQRGRIQKLGRKDAKAFSWFQNLQNLAFENGR